MTDYATDNTTPGAHSAPSETGPLWTQSPTINWSSTNRTPQETGSAGPRPNVGLAFPR